MCDAYYICWHTVASNTHNDILIAVNTMNDNDTGRSANLEAWHASLNDTEHIETL